MTERLYPTLSEQQPFVAKAVRRPALPLIKTTISATLVALACMGLSACGDKHKDAPSQVAAKVDSEEISVHQINQALSRVNLSNATPEQVATMSREVLEKLIDQQLAINQAIEEKLQRTPDVVARLENARREILAQSYVQQIISHVEKPTADEIHKYYVEHPQLFAERRVFKTLEVNAENKNGATDLLRSFVKSNKPAEEIAAALKAKDIKFSGGPATQSAEQIPLELLPKLQEVKDGEALVLESPKSVVFIRVVNSVPQPVTEEAAKSRIEQFITNQRANQAVADKLKQLRSAAKITYVGEFEKTAAQAAAAAASAAAAAAPAASADSSKAVLEKGIAGMK